MHTKKCVIFDMRNKMREKNFSLSAETKLSKVFFFALRSSAKKAKTKEKKKQKPQTHKITDKNKNNKRKGEG